MKKVRLMLPAILLCLLIAGCAGEKKRVPTVGEVSETVLTENAPIVMEVADETVARDAEEISLKVTNSSDEAYSFGEASRVEVFSDGAWHTLESAEGESSFDVVAIAHILPAEGTADATVRLALYGNRFDAGTYRVIKEFSPENGGETVTAAAEFEIAE